MGDNAEFEKLSTLEARLAAALDRIAVGLAEAQPVPPAEDPALTSGALEELQMRAEVAEARVAELEAQIAHPAEGPDTAALEAERDAARERVAALEAERAAYLDERDEANRALAERDAEIETLRGKVNAQAEQDAQTDALHRQLSELEAELVQLRAEHAVAIAERDEARGMAEDQQAASSVPPDDGTMTLRAELQELRVINERLTNTLARMRDETATDPDVLNTALVVELDALKAARASEAAELERILAELDGAGPMAAGESGHA